MAFSQSCHILRHTPCKRKLRGRQKNFKGRTVNLFPLLCIVDIISTVESLDNTCRYLGMPSIQNSLLYPVAICLVAESCFHKTPDLQSGGGDKSQNQTTELFKQALEQQTLTFLKSILYNTSQICSSGPFWNRGNSQSNLKKMN